MNEDPDSRDGQEAATCSFCDERIQRGRKWLQYGNLAKSIYVKIWALGVTDFSQQGITNQSIKQSAQESTNYSNGKTVQGGRSLYRSTWNLYLDEAD